MYSLANVSGQPRDERLSNTEMSRAIALRCDDWLGFGFILSRTQEMPRLLRELFDNFKRDLFV